MDATGFDRLARALGAALPRRAALAGLLGGALASRVLASNTEAKRKRKRKRKRKKKPSACAPSCGNARTCCGGVCADLDTDVRNCGGCGQACGSLQTCREGQCIPACDVCASGCAFAAVQAAVDAADPGATVTLCPGIYSGLVHITKSLTLEGRGGDPRDTILTNTDGPIVEIDLRVIVTISTLTITGMTTGSSSAIVNDGDLILDTVWVVENVTTGNGGGILVGPAGSTATLVDCEIRDNSARNGGGIYASGGTTVNLIRSRVEGNEAVQGGGIYNNTGTANVTDDSRVIDNTATADPPSGGGLFNINGVVAVNTGGAITGNDPDNCVQVAGGTGCPA
jgi:predicted outer membrane repeat protein